MSRYRRRPLTEAELWTDGAPCRVIDLMMISGYSRQTIIAAAESGELRAMRRPMSGSPYRFQRAEARAWLIRIGFTHAA